jgi:hypothetical protein
MHAIIPGLLATSCLTNIFESNQSKLIGEYAQCIATSILIHPIMSAKTNHSLADSSTLFFIISPIILLGTDDENYTVKKRSQSIHYFVCVTAKLFNFVIYTCATVSKPFNINSLAQIALLTALGYTLYRDIDLFKFK